MIIQQAVVKEILNDFTQTSLCSYQIAYKSGICQRTIIKTIKAHLGSELFARKEQLALTNLHKQIQELLAQKVGSNEIAERVGLCRNTCYAMIKQLRQKTTLTSCKTETTSDEICQLDSIEELDRLDFRKEASVQEAAVYVRMKDNAAESATQCRPYPVRKTYYPATERKEKSRNTPYHASSLDLLKIEYKGIRLSLDLNNVSEPIVSRLINCLTRD